MAVPRVLRIFKLRSEGNLEFWVSNAVIVLSTVLGVYRALRKADGPGFGSQLSLFCIKNMEIHRYEKLDA